MAYATEVRPTSKSERSETALENISTRLGQIIEHFRDSGVKMEQHLCRINGSSPQPAGQAGKPSDKIAAPTLVLELREKCRVLDEMASDLSMIADRLAQI